MSETSCVHTVVRGTTGWEGAKPVAKKIGKIPDFPAFGPKKCTPHQLDVAVVRFATERTMNLEPIDPETALELYLVERETEAAKATMDSHRSRLRFFVQWCDERDIENLNNLTGRRLHEFRLWRRNVGELTKITEKTQMDTLRVFIRWLESIDGVEQDLSLKVRSLDVTSEENTRDVMLDADTAEAMLEYLERYEYASLHHVTASLLWHTMMRMGAAHALDVEDYDPDGQCLIIKHRPETGTPLKNQKQGERLIALSGEMCLLLDDWLRNLRPEVTDDHGRRPLLASNYGRLAKSSIRRYATGTRAPASTRTSVRTTENRMSVKPRTKILQANVLQALVHTRFVVGRLHIT